MALIKIINSVVFCDVYLLGVNQAGHDVDGNWEDDRAVVLRRDCAQRLEIPQLEISCLSVQSVCHTVWVKEGILRNTFSVREACPCHFEL